MLWGYRPIFRIMVPVVFEAGGGGGGVISAFFQNMGCGMVPPYVTLSWNNLIKLYVFTI